MVPVSSKLCRQGSSTQNGGELLMYSREVSLSRDHPMHKRYKRGAGGGGPDAPADPKAVSKWSP